MSRLRRHEKYYAWTLLSPFVLSLAVLFVFALVRTIGFSFTDYDMFSEPNFVGLKNYANLFTDHLFILALRNTISFSLVVTTLQTVLALGLAVLLNAKIRGRTFFRTAYYLPSILSSAAITLIFMWIYQKKGFLNYFLSQLGSWAPLFAAFAVIAIIAQVLFVLNDRRRGYPCGWFDPAFAFLSVLIGAALTFVAWSYGWIETDTVKVETVWLNSRDQVGPLPMTLWAIVLQNIYTTVPTLMLLYLAGLQGISKDLYEAADIDGANKWQQLWHITVPQLAPVTFIVVTMGIIGTLQMFDQVALLGAAAPLESRITLAYYVYHNAFPPGATPQVGMASAAALVLAFLTLGIVYLQKLVGVKEKAND